MSAKRYSEKFKREAVKQITDGGYRVADVARRLGTSTHSLYAWLKKYDQGSEQASQSSQQKSEIYRLKTELKRVTEERDILKNYLETCFSHQRGRNLST